MLVKVKLTNRPSTIAFSIAYAAPCVSLEHDSVFGNKGKLNTASKSMPNLTRSLQTEVNTISNLSSFVIGAAPLDVSKFCFTSSERFVAPNYGKMKF